MELKTNRGCGSRSRSLSRLRSRPSTKASRRVLGGAIRKGLSFPGGDRSRFLLGGGMVSTVAGVRLGPSTAMTASAVYAATSLIAETIASLPYRFLERGDVGRVQQFPEQVRPLWERPNPYQTRVGFIETVVLSMLLWGNAYIYLRRDNGNRVIELWPLDPDRITDVEKVEDAQKRLGVRFRVSEWPDDDGWVTNRPGKPPEMLHIPLITAPGRIKGLSPIEQQAELIGISLSSQEHAARFLGDGVHMTGVLESPDALNVTQAQELYDNFSRIHAGPKKAGRVGVLTAGAAFKPLGIPPAELQFLEQMKYTDAKINGIYRAPPHLVGDVERSTSWGTGIEEQGTNYVQYRILPIARKIEESVEMTLLPGTQYQMRFVVNGLLRGNVKDRAEFYRTLWNLGALNDDEIRAFEDLAPLPEGQGETYYVPLNVVPAGTPPEALQTRAAALLAVIAGGN